MLHSYKFEDYLLKSCLEAIQIENKKNLLEKNKVNVESLHKD